MSQDETIVRWQLQNQGICVCRDVWLRSGISEDTWGMQVAGFLVVSRPEKKMVNKVLRVLKMETSDLRNINGTVYLAASEHADECRYLGSNWAGGCRSS